MISLQIKTTKSIMNALLTSESFDSYLLEEASIATFAKFQIDGHVVKEFFNNEELEGINGRFSVEEFSPWRSIRPICFSLIKGKKTPVSFRVILHAPKETVAQIAATPDCGVAADMIRSLMLSIRFENGRASCVTGSSYTTFIMDKSAEKLWDAYVRGELARLGIDFEEL